MPGDELQLDYRLPEHPERLELFLEARGYYLEWMRREWMAETNPRAAARLLLDPERHAARPGASVQAAGSDDGFTVLE